MYNQRGTLITLFDFLQRNVQVIVQIKIVFPADKERGK